MRDCGEEGCKGLNITEKDADACNKIYFDKLRILAYLEGRLIDLEWERDEMRYGRKDKDFNKIGIRNSSYGDYYTEYGKMILRNKHEIVGIVQEIRQLKKFTNEFKFTESGTSILDEGYYDIQTPEQELPYLNVRNNGPPIPKKSLTDFESLLNKYTELEDSGRVETSKSAGEEIELTKKERKLIKKFNKRSGMPIDYIPKAWL